MILALIALALVMSFAFPSTSNRVIPSVEAGFEKGLGKVGLGGSREAGPQQTHFTNIDDTLRVTKASNSWVSADYSLAPEPNDREVRGGRAYHLRISRNAFFTQASMVFDKSWSGSRITLALAEESYHWVVGTVGENGKESVESLKNRFSLIPKGRSKASIALELSDFLQQGHAIMVTGWTESGARVMVNGQETVVNPRRRFRHLTSPCRVETT